MWAWLLLQREWLYNKEFVWPFEVSFTVDQGTLVSACFVAFVWCAWNHDFADKHAID